MRGFVRNHPKLTAFLVLASAVAGLVGWELVAPVRGRVAARFDIMRGRYEILSVGLPVVWRPESARLLRERYGIEEQVVAGCIVSPSLLAYVEGYNRVSMNAANRKFGHDVFQENVREASRNWRLLVSTGALRTAVW
jgi:hypothetical protein